MDIVFIPESIIYYNATDEYNSIWNNEKVSIISSIKKVSSLFLAEKKITAIVYEGISHSGKDILSPMKLRASYPLETKKATLIHELLHRFLFQLKERLGYTEHEMLFLILYDTWVDLYGKEFGDKQVEVESKRKGYLDYARIWKNTLHFNYTERQTKWKEILKANKIT